MFFVPGIYRVFVFLCGFARVTIHIIVYVANPGYTDIKLLFEFELI